MESNHRVIDSSVFVAFYREVDSQHEDAIRVMQEISGFTLIVHPYVIQETATVLTYGCGVAVAKQFLSDIGNASNIIIPAIDIQHDARLFMASGAKLSFTDVALIGLAKEMGTSLVTFDKQMLKLIRKFA